MTFRPHMADDFQPGRDFLQHLGDVLAEFDQMRAATIGADLGSWVHHILTRQMHRQRFAHRR